MNELQPIITGLSAIALRPDVTAKDLVDPAAVRQRDALVAEAQSIECVESPEAQQIAYGVAAQLRKMSREAEERRKADKAPYLQIGSLIDQAVKLFDGPLVKEYDRVTAMLVRYQQKLDKQRAEEEARRQAELRRIADENARLEAERKAAEKAVLMAAPAEAAQAAERIDELALQQAQLRQQASQQVVAAESDNVHTRRPWDFQVTDIWALAKARPDLVTIEPKRAEIKRIIAAAKGKVNIPGILPTQELQVIVKT